MASCGSCPWMPHKPTFQQQHRRVCCASLSLGLWWRRACRGSVCQSHVCCTVEASLEKSQRWVVVLVLSLLREFLRHTDATGPANHTHFALRLAPALFRRCRGVPSAQQCVFAQRTNAMWRSRRYFYQDSFFGSTWTVSPEWRSVVPVLVLSMLGSSACKKSAANRFDTSEGLLVVVRRISLDNTHSTAQQLHMSKSLVTRTTKHSCVRGW